MTHKILVVDDQSDERDAISRLLRLHDYDVEAVANGHEAIERTRHGARPDLVVLDLNMPVMDGWEFLEEAGRDTSLRDMPVVVMSGAPEVRDACVLLPNISFVAKPLRPLPMLNLIAAMLRPLAGATTDGRASDGVAIAIEEVDTLPYPVPIARLRPGITVTVG